MKRRTRVVLSSILVVVVIAASYAGYVWKLYRDAETAVKDPALDDDIDPPEQAQDPYLALLVGSDSREGLTEEEQDRLGAQDVNPDGSPITGERADTLILLRVDPSTEHLTIVQFPRDLYVTFPDGSKGKVNAALDRGRPFMVQTIEDVTGLELNQYAQVNIAGFRDLIDAIGGVDVCFPDPIPFDASTGFEITEREVGIVHLDGERALRFVRSRRSFAEGDFARIANQQKLLTAAIDKAISLGTALRPDRMNALFGAIKNSIKTDSYSSFGELRELGARFTALTDENVDAYVVPNRGTATNEAGDVVVPAIPKMALLFNALRSEGDLDSVAGRLDQWETDIPLRGSTPAVCR